jgi:hypothetical protein
MHSNWKNRRGPGRLFSVLSLHDIFFEGLIGNMPAPDIGYGILTDGPAWGFLDLLSADLNALVGGP